MQKGGQHINDKKQTFDQSKYIQRYMKETYLRVQILLNKETDADVIEHLKKQKSMSRYVKELIRKDMVLASDD